jgi:hypothetical protein
MRAELTILHQRGDAVAALSRAFGPHDPTALKRSVFAQKSPESAHSIAYAVFQPQLILLAWPTPERLIVYVEADGGRLRWSSAQVWDGARRALKDLKPKLDSLVLLDEDKGDEIAAAAVGLAANVRRSEFIATGVTGIATAIVLVLAATRQLAGFELSTDLMIGSIPALIAAIIALVILGMALQSKRLIWR